MNVRAPKAKKNFEISRDKRHRLPKRRFVWTPESSGRIYLKFREKITVSLEFYT